MHLPFDAQFELAHCVEVCEMVAEKRFNRFKANSLSNSTNHYQFARKVMTHKAEKLTTWLINTISKNMTTGLCLRESQQFDSPSLSNSAIAG